MPRSGVGAWIPGLGGRIGFSQTDRARCPTCRISSMPIVRHRIPKMKFTVSCWAEYDAGLRRRGSLTVWVTQDAIDACNAEPRTTPGGQATYCDSAIQTCLVLRTAFKMALRQTEGLMASIFELLDCELTVPGSVAIRIPPRRSTLPVACPLCLATTGRVPSPPKFLIATEPSSSHRRSSQIKVFIDDFAGVSNQSPPRETTNTLVQKTARPLLECNDRSLDLELQKESREAAMAASQVQGQATQGRELSTLAPLRALPARTSDRARPRPGVGEGVMSCPRAGCGRSACPVR